MILGGLCIVLGAVLEKNRVAHLKYGGRTDGTVAQIVNGNPDSGYYYPVVTFYAGGRLYREKSRAGNSNPHYYRVNDKVRIKYREEDPTDFYIEETAQKMSRSRKLYYAGFLLILIGGIIYVTGQVNLGMR